MQEYGHRYKDNHDVGGNIEDGVGNQVIGGSGALSFLRVSQVCHLCEGTKLTVVRRDGPVLVEWPAPYSQIQNLHDHEANSDIGCHNFDGKVCLQTQTVRSVTISYIAHNGGWKEEGTYVKR